MYASVIEGKFIAEKRDEAIALMDGLIEELSSKVEGLRGIMVLDRGNDISTTVAVYDTKANFEAAAPIAQEVLGKLAPYLAEMPQRAGCEVLYGKRFATD